MTLDQPFGRDADVDGLPDPTDYDREQKPPSWIEAENARIAQLVYDAWDRGGSSMITIDTPRCLHCGKDGQLEVDQAAMRSYQAGALVQEVWPDKDADWREQMMTGIHPACWDEMMGAEEE